MAGLNQAIIVGRLGKDPESKSFQNGGKIVVFSVATSETWKDKNSGERKDMTEWHNVKIENEALGDIASRYLRKGSEVAITGKIKTRKWQDQSGADRYTTEIVVGKFDGTLTLIGERQTGERTIEERTTQRNTSTTRQRAPVADDLDDLSDDVPF